MKVLSRRQQSLAALAIGALAAALIPAAPQAAPGGAPDRAPVEVGVIRLKAQDVPRSVEVAGRVVAYQTAEIRPQVDGVVAERVYVEGSTVQKGDVLFRLDAKRLEAERAAALAELRKAEAAVPAAKSKIDRYERLAGGAGAQSAQNLEDARAAYATAVADVAVAEASLDLATINLEFATIRAPIRGQISAATVSIGSLVTQNQTTALATIRQLDPIYVDLVDTSANLLKIREEVRAGTLPGPNRAGPPNVSLKLETGAEFDQKGRIETPSVVVSESTATFTLRARFDNPRRMLLPGMFVRASVDLGASKGAFLVPQRAVVRQADGAAVAYLVVDGAVVKRTLETSRSIGAAWLVTAGVAEGDALIVDGFQKISEGAAVTPVEVTIDADGVIRQQLGADQNEAGR